MIHSRGSSTGCTRTPYQQLSACIQYTSLLLLILGLLTVFPTPLRADVPISQISPKLSVFRQPAHTGRILGLV